MTAPIDEPPLIHSWPDRQWAENYEQQQHQRGWRCVTVDTTLRWDKAGFLAACQTAFGFPDWFGRNWDALADSLTDVTADPGTGVLVTWRGWGPMARQFPGDFAVARDVLAEAVTRQQGWGTPWLVALVGPGPTSPVDIR